MTAQNTCLYCYRSLEGEQIDFHPGCSRKIFNKPKPPDLPYSEADMYRLALKIIQSQITVPGVQAKISLNIEKPGRGIPPKFTIVGLWGNFILKPPSDQYPFLPELEDLTMHLAEMVNITTVPHSLVRFKSGSLAYITKRVDRVDSEKFPMEDMSQLSGRLTEHKYLGSHEQIAKIILQHSASPGLDIIHFFEQILFCYLTGNSDMHLKNFSLINQPGIGPVLSPAYDMVPSLLLIPEDPEELALTLNGKKRNLSREDFESFALQYGIEKKTLRFVFKKFGDVSTKWFELINKSFLPQELKNKFIELIKNHRSKIGLT